MRYLFSGWFSATADWYYNAKCLCSKCEHFIRRAGLLTSRAFFGFRLAPSRRRSRYGGAGAGTLAPQGHTPQLPMPLLSATLFVPMNKRFYITTAIDYVNGQPHLGHAYEKIVADVIARSRRSLGQDVFFLTGLDEHGQKVQQAAQAEGKSPQAYCDELAADWQAFAKKLELTNDDFVRTTDPRHKEFVQAILAKLHAAGHFYKASYTGFYSTKEETFLTTKDRRPDGTFDPSYGEVVELQEDNYYFKLKAHQQWLIDYLEKNPSFVQPDYRRNEVLGFLKNNELEDLCITRPAARLNWGIPLPFDKDFVTYVWFDALVNYISIPAAHGDATVLSALKNPQPSTPINSDESRAGREQALNPQLSLWPADIHVVGKDIVKFHAVFWPIMLKAMGLPLPKQILVHGWWQKDGAKISKSTGNLVDPIAVIDEWGLDAFRFYVLRELDIGPDGNWTDAGFKSRYQAELANGLGNLINRSLSMLKRYRNGVVPAKHDELAAAAAKAADETRALFEQNQLQAALQSIWGLVTRANQYVDQTKPFKLAKDPAQAKRLDEVLYNLTETCRVLAVLLWPFLPGTAVKIYAQLGLTGIPDKFDAATWGSLPAGHKIGEPAPLFPRKDER
jgi:methionyl-tRNA synthetase